MSYTLLRGVFVIRYSDLPRQGPEPDGDTVKFRADSPLLVEGLARRSGTPPDINARGISVRLEAIDALETHQLMGQSRITGCGRPSSRAPGSRDQVAQHGQERPHILVHSR